MGCLVTASAPPLQPHPTPPATSLGDGSSWRGWNFWALSKTQLCVEGGYLPGLPGGGARPRGQSSQLSPGSEGSQLLRAKSSERRFLLVSRPSPRCPCSPAAAVTFLVSGSLSLSLIPGAVKFLLCLNLLELVSDT